MLLHNLTQSLDCEVVQQASKVIFLKNLQISLSEKTVTWLSYQTIFFYQNTKAN